MSEAVGIDPQARRRGYWVPERNAVVPPWQQPIKDFSIRVKMETEDGIVEVPPGFTIGDVAEEYRWPINVDTGLLWSDAEYKLKYPEWYNLHYTMQNPPAQIEGKPESLPGVVEFVSRKVDPNDISKVVPMNYDANRPVISKPRLMYDRDGENPITPEQAQSQKDASAAGSKMEVLMDLHADGVISDQEFAERAKAIFGGSVVVGAEGADSAEPAAAGSPPPAGFEQKPDAPHKNAEVATAPEAPTVEMVPALCGKDVTPTRLNQHQSVCGKCKAIKESQGE